MRVRFPLRAPRYKKKPLAACFYIFSEVREIFPAPSPYIISFEVFVLIANGELEKGISNLGIKMNEYKEETRRTLG